ncbi:Membrane-anchored ubiquitin-fold protein 3-like [Heracleum sosnowskyi]|uniref:Membrane-anchored ubiquitin-fold protein 3-like n=1 Tax=Heracleum sosnowskyi TaxID=360622 RepID=A0AAD8IIJ5_9APIA|nr:Membrane-anchored ubiquitin-fold protein 3-like [Heracleum sosnowskyi]
MNGLSRNSTREIQEMIAKTQEKETKNRMCDFCGEESKAILYCRADAAKLCLDCDIKVHSTNQLFTKHTRYLLCDSCDSSPCSIFCSNHDLVLCQNCDWEKHGSVSLLHDRRPLDGFNGCPSVTELLATFGIEDLGQKRGEKGCGFDDYLIWDTPCMVGLDGLIVSDGSDHNFVATDVPPLPKNRNTVCGQHKEEIICQLRQMAKLKPNFDDDQFDNEHFSEFSSAFKDNGNQKDYYFDLEQNMEANNFPSYPASALKFSPGKGANQGFASTPLQSFCSTTSKVPDGKTDSGQNLHQENGHETQADSSVNVGVAQILPKVARHEFSSQERDSAITRYKEKKKCRRYEKQIRYESRKIRAENRVRIRGRFAKKDH